MASRSADLFGNTALDLTKRDSPLPPKVDRRSMVEEIGRIDGDNELRERLLPFCRLKPGEVWTDPKGMHRIAVTDATDAAGLAVLTQQNKPTIIIADPPYNVVVGARNTEALFKKSAGEYDRFSKNWTKTVLSLAAQDASFYVWLGADYKNGFHPIPEFCQMMRDADGWIARNWITVRNQRGYGTQKNWMWVRQELLYYARGNAHFDVMAEYTDIPKVLKGYYKQVGGKLTENTERGKSDTIRAGNVWIDIQQVFYRLEENVPGCYAQKPVKAIERIIASSANKDAFVFDPFVHSGTTVIAAEKLRIPSASCDLDPIYAEITIRRLEHYRKTGRLGWQCKSPFPELSL